MESCYAPIIKTLKHKQIFEVLTYKVLFLFFLFLTVYHDLIGMLKMVLKVEVRKKKDLTKTK